jgi:hypothetical protein
VLWCHSHPPLRSLSLLADGHSINTAMVTVAVGPLGPVQLLHLAHNLTRLAQALHHLLALLPSPDRKVALLEQVLELVAAVHVLE